MKAFNSIRFVSSAVLTLVIGTLAQTSTAQDTSPSRADVKAQTKAANSSGDLWRGGETPLPERPFQTTKSRSDRKAETLAARKRGDLSTSGEAHFKSHTARPLRSDRTRAERKAETRQAIKDGTLAPAGEAEDPGQGRPQALTR